MANLVSLSDSHFTSYDPCLKCYDHEESTTSHIGNEHHEKEKGADQY